jgi:trimeric autotransporter adhesin
VGGQFTTLSDSSTSAKNIAAWDGSAWSTLPIGSSNGVVGSVDALADFGGKLYVGGTFTTLGDGTSTNCIAAWDGSAWSNLTIGASNGVVGGVAALSVIGGKLYVGGSFTTLGDGTPANRIVTWSSTSSFDDVFRSSLLPAAGFSSNVASVAMFDGKVYVGGTFAFTSDGTTSANRIAAWDGSVWSNLTIGASNGVGSAVRTLAVFGSKLYVGGLFTTLGDGTTSAKYIAAWDGSAWSILPIGSSNGIGGQVVALAVFGGKLYVGGFFTTLGDGTSAKYIAAWDGSAWSTLPIGSSNGVGGTVSALAVFGGKLYVGGQFTALGDGTTSANRIAAWDGSSWSALPIGSSNGVVALVNALSVFGGKLYVGGTFTTLGDGTTSANRIAAWDGSAWSALPIDSSNGVGSGTVSALSVFSGKLYVGGVFTTLGDGTTSANRIAAWDGSTWSALSVGGSNGLSGPVSAMAANGSSYLYIGGGFTGFGDNSGPAGNFVRYGM